MDNIPASQTQDIFPAPEEEIEYVDSVEPDLRNNMNRLILLELPTVHCTYIYVSKKRRLTIFYIDYSYI
jgi:hypothetical protein